MTDTIAETEVPAPVIGDWYVVTVDNADGSTFPADTVVRLDEPRGTYGRFDRIDLPDDHQSGRYATRSGFVRSVSWDQVRRLPGQAGERARVRFDRPRNAPVTRGATVEVIEGYGGRDGALLITRIGEHDRSDGSRMWVYPSDLEHLPVMEETEAFVPDTVSRAEYDAVVADRDRVVRDRDALRNWQSSALTDIDTASEVLNTAATRKDLCEEYEEAVESANQRMTVLQFTHRERDIDVSWTETYTVTVTRTETTSARRGDEGDAAEEYAANSDTLTEAALIDLLRDNGSHEYVDDSADNVDWSYS
jgi:hypothetical protein